MLRFNVVNFETVSCIARLGSFGAAAARLHASQPAITARVRELEQSVGVPFFQKRGRRMELTIEGRAFLQRVEPLVRRIEQEVQVHAAPGSLQGVVRLGIAHVMLRWFPEVVAQLRRDMPDVRYEIDVDAGASMVQKLEAGRIDIAVVAGKTRGPRMVAVDLQAEELQWLMSTRLPRLRDRRTLGTAELLDSAPIWLMPRSSVVYPLAVEVLQRQQARLHNLNTCVHMAGILEMVEHTCGIGLTAASVARGHLAAGRVEPVSPDLAPIRLEVSLLYHPDQQQAIVRRVIDRIVEFDRRRNAPCAGGEHGGGMETGAGSPG